MPKIVEMYATSAAETAGQVERGVKPGFQLTYDSGTRETTGARATSSASAMGAIFDRAARDGITGNLRRWRV